MFYLLKLILVSSKKLKDRWQACDNVNYTHRVSLYLSILFFAPTMLLTLNSLPSELFECIWLTPHPFSYVCAFFLAHSRVPPTSDTPRRLQLFKYLRKLRVKLNLSPSTQWYWPFRVIKDEDVNIERPCDHKHIAKIIGWHDDISSKKWLAVLDPYVQNHYILGVLFSNEALSFQLLDVLSKQGDTGLLLDTLCSQLGRIDNCNDQMPLWFGVKFLAKYVRRNSCATIPTFVRQAVLVRYASTRQCTDQELGILTRDHCLDTYQLFQICIRNGNFERANMLLTQQTTTDLWSQVCVRIDELTTILLSEYTKAQESEVRLLIQTINSEFVAVTNPVDSSFSKHLYDALCRFAEEHSGVFHVTKMWHWLFSMVGGDPTRDAIVRKLWIAGNADILLEHYLQPSYTNRLLNSLAESGVANYTSTVHGAIPELFARSTLSIRGKLQCLTKLQEGLPFLTGVDCLAVAASGSVLRIRTVLLLLALCITMGFAFPHTILAETSVYLLASVLVFLVLAGSWRVLFYFVPQAHTTATVITGILLFWAQFGYAALAEMLIPHSYMLVFVVGVVTTILCRVLLISRIRPRFSTQLYCMLLPMAFTSSLQTLPYMHEMRFGFIILYAFFWQLAPTSYGQLII